MPQEKDQFGHRRSDAIPPLFGVLGGIQGAHTGEKAGRSIARIKNLAHKALTEPVIEEELIERVSRAKNKGRVIGALAGILGGIAVGEIIRRAFFKDE